MPALELGVEDLDQLGAGSGASGSPATTAARKASSRLGITGPMMPVATGRVPQRGRCAGPGAGGARLPRRAPPLTSPDGGRVDDTEVRERSPGQYDADLGSGWVVGAGVNGGYLLATIGRAIARTVPAKPDPIAISAYYLSASAPGPATVSTRVLRDGGSVATVAADLVQGDTARITALATYGDLAGLPDDVRTTATPPDLPPREQCVGTAEAPPEFRAVAPPLLSRFELLFDPDAADGSGQAGAPHREDPAPVRVLGDRPERCPVEGQ